MAGFIPRTILVFLWNPLSGATPFRNKNGIVGLGGAVGGKARNGSGRVRSPGDFGVPVEPTLRCDPLQKKKTLGRRALSQHPVSLTAGHTSWPFFFLVLKGVAPESGFHRDAKIARGMNPATPFPPSRVGAVQAEVL